MIWICPKCSEQHEVQFEVCWKCSGDEAQTAFSAGPLPTVPAERELRPLRDFILRAIGGFCVGFIVTMMLLSLGNTTLAGFMFDNSLLAATIVSLVGGAIVGAVVGVFFWVLFPYRSLPRQMFIDSDPEARQDNSVQRST